jgi:uncharacterized protein (TIGR03437 family)
MRWFYRLLLPALAAASLQAQSTSQQQLYRADLNYVATQLPRLHANFFFQLNQADFNPAVNQLDSQIPNLTDSEFYVRLAGLVAMAGDPHTAFYLNTASGFQQFPMQFRWLDDGVFVTGAAPEYAQAMGTQLVAVGDFGMDVVEAKLAGIIPHTNPYWVHQTGARFLSVLQILEGLDLVPSTASTVLTFRDRTGRSFSLSVGTESAGLQAFPAAAQGPIPLYLQTPELNYWFTYSAPLRLLYFKYNRCAQMASDPFADFAGRLLQALDSNPVDTLVFDYRGNGGGNSAIIDPLFKGLNQRLNALLANPNLRIYDVIDQGTFSSALDNAMTMKSGALAAAAQLPGAGLEKRLVVIGQSSGGPTSGYGEVLNFTLPSGKMQGQYSTKYFSAPEYIPAAPAFVPDVAVPFISSDYFARHDPVMAAVLARWSGSPPPPSGTAIVVNGASFRLEQGLAPGEFAVAFGAFSAVPDQLLVNGQTAELLGATASQVDFVVPASVATGPAAISVRAGGQEIASGQVTITSAGPALFVLNATDTAQPGAILNQDSEVNGTATPATAGSVLQIFATGNGPLDASGAAPVAVLIGGAPADVLYSAPVAGSPGLWQINARLPAGITGQVPVFIIAGTTASNGTTVWVQ